MGHAHHHHDHTHAADLKGRNLLISIGLNVLITLAQIIGGLISGSLALLSDAVHNLSDVISLIISYIAQRYSKKEASTHKTFGYKRAEIIAAFVNAATLIVIAVLLMKEAVERFLNPQAIASDLVIWLAVLGIVANGLSVLLLQKDSKGNMNMRSAYLHLLTDMMASVAVLVGGILMYFFKIYWIDSLLTLAISIYLIVMGYGLLKSSFKVLMLFSPEYLEIDHLIKKIKLSAFDAILLEIEHIAMHYGINHINIQPEYDKDDAKEIVVQD